MISMRTVLNPETQRVQESLSTGIDFCDFEHVIHSWSTVVKNCANAN